MTLFHKSRYLLSFSRALCVATIVAGTCFGRAEHAGFGNNEVMDLLRAGKLDEAQNRVQELVAEHTKDVKTLCSLAMVQFFLRQFADAHATLERAKTLAPKDADIYATLGLVLSNESDLYGLRWRDAIAAYTKATELDPKCADAWFNLAVLYTSIDPPEPMRARAAYQKALRLGCEPDKALAELIERKLDTNAGRLHDVK